jgi:hypothetical protein
MNQPVTVNLDPALLERFKRHGILKANFAYFEQHDEWNLEDISVEFADGRRLDECFGDALEVEFRTLLEDVSDTRVWAQDGFFEVDVAGGTITKRSEAFVSELRWWQLPESVQQALIEARVV